MIVATILAEKGRAVFTLPPDTSMREAIDQLAEKRVGAVLVTEGDDKVRGILSERDVVREIAVSGASVLDRPIASCMTRTVVACSETDTVDQVMGMMTEQRFRHMPVIKDGRLCGIVSIGDVVKRKIEQAERDAQELRNYIAAG